MSSAHPQFTDDLLRAGFSGGQRAAKSLLSSLPAMLNHASISRTSSTFGTDLVLPANEPVAVPASPDGHKREMGAGGAVVTVFFNKSGLGSALVKVSLIIPVSAAVTKAQAGIVATFSMFESFIQGFGASHELFTGTYVALAKTNPQWSTSARAKKRPTPKSGNTSASTRATPSAK